MKAMMTFFAAVLSTIAVGVMLVAYGLLSPRISARDDVALQPVPGNQRVSPAVWDGTMPVPRPAAYAADGTPLYDARALVDARNAYDGRVVNEPRAIPAVETFPTAPRTTTVARPVSYQQKPVRVERAPSRDWLKTAMVIGGTTAAGAGLGGIFGGKKGALIGAAIGGGASTIYEVQKR
ncbi:MAG TPA: hypothetical protein VH497_13060 [Vicinamibacterales bacterium]|jgi:hypothetical protein